MRHIIYIIAVSVFLMTACGESAKERQAREAAEAQRIADSIAEVEALQAKLEQKRLDSIASAEKRAARMAADSAVRAELLPSFVEEKNADESGASMYAIKGAPKSHYQNYAYLSFTVDNGSAREIFINACYCGSNWLNIEGASLIIDDNAESISLSSDNISNTNDHANCCEWFKAAIYSSLCDKLMDAKSVKLKLIGDENSKEITLSARQISDMQKTIRLYRAFGG